MDGSLLCILIFQIFLISYGDSYQLQGNLKSNIPAEQPYRTAYHFQPPKNWMNDPNGPMYYKGVYHLFYQYNPYAAVWGNITWAHSVSYNLIDWVHLEDAINPTEPYDIGGCWSGSATILPGGEPAILYTGDDFKNRQVQNLAVPKNSSDPFLREWVKSDHNPVMTPVNDIDPQFFRDPTTAWRGPDKIWRVIVGSQIDGHGTALLYKSEDFVKWTRSDNPLHSSNKTGMWECPDFYPVNDSATIYVLKASFKDRDYYILGTYDPQTDKFVVDIDFMDPKVQLRYDYGMFYASKTFYDSAKDRRVLWGWVTEADGEINDIKKGWNGLQSIPRNVILDTSRNQLVQWPVTELEQLRDEEVNLRDKEIPPGTVLEISGITTSQADVDVSFNVPSLEDAEPMGLDIVDPQLLCNQTNASTRGVIGPFGLLVLASEDLNEQTAIFFRVFKMQDKYVVLMCSDQSRSSLREEVDKRNFGAFVDIDPSKPISLRTLIDHSIVESFGGDGRSCITSRVYPKVAIDKEAHLYVFNNGTTSVTISSLKAWSMKNAQIVPLHKRRKPTVH